MIEEYTTTNGDNGNDRMCPFRFASSSTLCRCMGRKCMAWVVQLDDSGKPTGNGRCGMVGVILQMPVTTCASWDEDETKDDPLLLREENEKLRAQVEGLKECVGYAGAQALFPNLNNDQLLAAGKKMMEEQDVDAFLARWRENTK